MTDAEVLVRRAERALLKTAFADARNSYAVAITRRKATEHHEQTRQVANRSRLITRCSVIPSCRRQQRCHVSPRGWRNTDPRRSKSNLRPQDTSTRHPVIVRWPRASRRGQRHRRSPVGVVARTGCALRRAGRMVLDTGRRTPTLASCRRANAGDWHSMSRSTR